MAVAAWALFALAGARPWTLPPLILAAAGLAAVVRPRAFSASSRVLDGALLCCLALTALQLIPLPDALRAALSPGRAAVEQALILGTPTTGPLTLNPAATAWALATGGALLLLFWSARALFERREGLRHVTRWIAWLGFAVAALAFVQRALSPTLVYGLWRPADLASNILPWGPFINRNDFAAWLVMAIPLTVGYLLMRSSSNRATGDARLDAGAVVDPRLIQLLAATCLMTGAILASLSRSGILSVGLALASLIALARARLGRARTGLLAIGVGALIVAAGAYANLPALLSRMNEAWPSGLGGRLAVWAATWPIVQDFLLTGVGVGAYQRAMLVYQQGNRLMFFNHAHNEYLQIAAEGGLLLTVPVAVAIVRGIGIAARNLRNDQSPVFWTRAGATCGMIGVACQSLWDTGLRLPANAVLFAILAAIALHVPLRRDDDSRPGRVENLS